MSSCRTHWGQSGAFLRGARCLAASKVTAPKPCAGSWVLGGVWLELGFLCSAAAGLLLEGDVGGRLVGTGVGTAGPGEAGAGCGGFVRRGGAGGGRGGCRPQAGAALRGHNASPKAAGAGQVPVGWGANPLQGGTFEPKGVIRPSCRSWRRRARGGGEEEGVRHLSSARKEVGHPAPARRGAGGGGAGRGGEGARRVACGQPSRGRASAPRTNP